MEDENLHLSTAQIGRCGELLVQYELLRQGIESAALTTDAGIDLIAYSARTGRPVSIQVKTCREPKPGGGTGRPSLDWSLRRDSPADLAAFVDISRSLVWIFRREELHDISTHNERTNEYHFYFYTEEAAAVREEYRREATHGHRLITKRVVELFGAP